MCSEAYKYYFYRKDWCLTKDVIEHVIKRISYDLQLYMYMILFNSLCLFNTLAFIPSPRPDNRKFRTSWKKMVNYKRSYTSLTFVFDFHILKKVLFYIKKQHAILKLKNKSWILFPIKKWIVFSILKAGKSLFRFQYNWIEVYITSNGYLNISTL